MQHLGDDEVAGAAVGEPLAAAAAAHLDTCAACRRQLAHTERATRALRRAGSDTVVLERPPDRVWAGVQAALTAGPGESAPVPAPGWDSHPAPGQGWTRRRAVAATAVAFAVGAAAATIGVLVVQRGGDSPQRPLAARTLAVGTLAPLPGQQARGAAAVVDGAKAGRRITITVHGGQPTGTSFVQAWLLDPRTNKMVALGVMEGDRETFALPAALDLATFDYVDISREPYDGNPAHSAVSLARGRLDPS